MPDSPTSASIEPVPIPGLGAVVLCGGKSERLGIDKTQLIFRGRTFLETIVDLVRQSCAPLVLVGETDFEQHDLPSGVLFDRDRKTGQGPLEGIRVGLERLQPLAEYAFVTSCDVPLLRPELIRFLFQQIGTHEAIVPVDDQRIYGMTSIYRTYLHQQASQRIANRQLRVCDFATSMNTLRIDVDGLRSVDPSLDSMTNVNSSDDYRDLLERCGLDFPPEIANRLARIPAQDQAGSPKPKR